MQSVVGWIRKQMGSKEDLLRAIDDRWLVWTCVKEGV